MVTAALFGSGVSYVSKIPGIKDITNRILNGENVGREGDSIYYINQGQKYLEYHMTENLNLLCHIKNDIQSFYNRLNVEHHVNYEDIYYVLKQIKDSFYFEFENPAINSLIEKLQAIETFSGDKLINIAKETLIYIESIVWQMISYRKFTVDQFSIIPQLIERLNLANVISLNHDMVLDTYLSNNNINYNDGFEIIHYKYPEWIGFKNKDNQLNLLKLHGSVDWFEVGVLRPNRTTTIVKLPTNIYIQAVHNEEESFWGTIGGTPKILIGTFNKMLGYLSDVFETLYDEFKLKLTESNILIISGYGFGDKGINTQLSYWLNHKTSKKMIIIHPFKDELIQKSRGNFRQNLMNQNSKHEKVELIEKKFEEVSTDEIIEAIHKK